MKRNVFAFLMTLILIFGASGVCSAVPVQNTDEVYMGLTMSSDWRVLSKNMTDAALLKALDLTVDEVNEMLINGECERMIINVETKDIINVKVEENAFFEEMYNITETEDEAILEQLDSILTDGFSVDGFEYHIEDVTITKHPQMKFVTVPGKVSNDGRKRGMIFGATFINGKGIAFLMPLATAKIQQENLDAFSEVVGTVTFTAIKDKDEAGVKTEGSKPEKEPQQGALSYIVGGLGGLILVAICLYLFDRIKKSPKADVLDNARDSEDEEIDR